MHKNANSNLVDKAWYVLRNANKPIIPKQVVVGLLRVIDIPDEVFDRLAKNDKNQ